MFNIIEFQDKIGEEYKSRKAAAIGKHWMRTCGALRRKAKKHLMDLGWEESQAFKIVQDAVDMAELEMMCE